MIVQNYCTNKNQIIKMFVLPVKTESGMILLSINDMLRICFSNEKRMKRKELVFKFKRRNELLVADPRSFDVDNVNYEKKIIK
jgi:hypothetical protein